MAPSVSLRAAVERQAEWRRVRKLSRWNRKRGFRRTFVAAWLTMLVAVATFAFALARVNARAALYPAAITFAASVFVFRRIEIDLAQPSLEDRALLEYGADFDALKETERSSVLDQQIRDGIVGRARRDEREAELRLRAAGAAYQLVRPLLAMALAMYWAFCLCGPIVAERPLLTQTAVVFTLLALAIAVLPTLIRMWTETADETGEPRLVGGQAGK